VPRRRIQLADHAPQAMAKYFLVQGTENLAEALFSSQDLMTVRVHDSRAPGSNLPGFLFVYCIQTTPDPRASQTALQRARVVN
jgi:hypothetical protein